MPTMRSGVEGGTALIDDLDLVADLNAQDDDGLGWSMLSQARCPADVRPGRMILVCAAASTGGISGLYPHGNCPTACWTIESSGQASANVRMYSRFDLEKPDISGTLHGGRGRAARRRQDAHGPRQADKVLRPFSGPWRIGIDEYAAPDPAEPMSPRPASDVSRTAPRRQRLLSFLMSVKGKASQRARLHP